MANELKLYVGNTKPFDVVIGEALEGSDRASFTIKDSTVDGATVILQRDTVAGNLAIDLSNKKLTATLTGVEADALTAGTYVGQAGVRFGSDDDWQFTDYFTVEISSAVVDKV